MPDPNDYLPPVHRSRPVQIPLDSGSRISTINPIGGRSVGPRSPAIVHAPSTSMYDNPVDDGDGYLLPATSVRRRPRGSSFNRYQVDVDALAIEQSEAERARERYRDAEYRRRAPGYRAKDRYAPPPTNDNRYDYGYANGYDDRPAPGPMDIPGRRDSRGYPRSTRRRADSLDPQDGRYGHRAPLDLRPMAAGLAAATGVGVFSPPTSHPNSYDDRGLSRTHPNPFDVSKDRDRERRPVVHQRVNSEDFSNFDPDPARRRRRAAANAKESALESYDPNESQYAFGRGERRDRDKDERRERDRKEKDHDVSHDRHRRERDDDEYDSDWYRGEERKRTERSRVRDERERDRGSDRDRDSSDYEPPKAPAGTRSARGSNAAGDRSLVLAQNDGGNGTKEPLKGILKAPRQEPFPDRGQDIREGALPDPKEAKKKGLPADARWTKISRKLVNPAALVEAKERFEERVDSVIVLRVLTKEEIQQYAERTQILRGAYTINAGD
jgi:hypothetical protein